MEVENLHREAYKDRLMQRMDELDDAEEGNSAEIHGIAMLGHPAEEWMNDTTSGEFSPRELSDDEEEFLDEVATNIVRDFLDESGVDRSEMERDMYSFLMQR